MKLILIEVHIKLTPKTDIMYIHYKLNVHVYLKGESLKMLIIYVKKTLNFTLPKYTPI